MTESKKGWKILEPIQIGNLTCRNRVLMAAHSYGYVDENGLPTHYLASYLAERAKGGVGLVIMGGTSVTREGLHADSISINTNDEIIPRYQMIAQQVHLHGALVFDQLMHSGGQLDPNEQVVVTAPSSIPHEASNSIPVEMTVNDILTTINDFANAARRVKIGNLDGIEIKGDQGFLIHQFLSPYYNRRNDQYGGSYQKRLRFLIELIDAIKETVGNNFVVGLRLTGDSMTNGDLTLKHSVQIAKDLTKLGKLDYLHVNGATNSTYRGYLINHGDSSIPSMNFFSLSKEIKKVVDIPVFAASMILHPEEAEHFLASDAADMVAMTRAHIADPEIVNKVIQDRIDDIRPCVLSNQGCVGNHWKGRDVRCIHNAATGREEELGLNSISKVKVAKKIMVIGGGVAGLEFARIAAMRGHSIDLYEEKKILGGQILLSAQLPYKSNFLGIVKYLERQIKMLHVNVHLGVEVTISDIITVSKEFDLIAVATGSTPYIPPIYKKIEESKALSIQDLLNGTKEVGDAVLIVDMDWRQNALGVAEWLVQKGKKVTIITSDFYIGANIDVATRTSYYSRLLNRVNFLPLTTLEAFSNGVAQVRNTLTNISREIKGIDQVVFITGSKPKSELYQKLKDKIPTILPFGDCLYPRGIPEAILEANRLARNF